MTITRGSFTPVQRVIRTARAYHGGCTAHGAKCFILNCTSRAWRVCSIANSDAVYDARLTILSAIRELYPERLRIAAGPMAASTSTARFFNHIDTGPVSVERVFKRAYEMAGGDLTLWKAADPNGDKPAAWRYVAPPSPPPSPPAVVRYTPPPPPPAPRFKKPVAEVEAALSRPLSRHYRSGHVHAHMLKARIEAYWRKQNRYNVSVTVEFDETQGEWVVRSNLINGAPKPWSYTPPTTHYADQSWRT